MACVTTTQFCHCSLKADRDNMQTGGSSRSPEKLYLQNQVQAASPVGCHLPASALEPRFSKGVVPRAVGSASTGACWKCRRSGPPALLDPPPWEGAQLLAFLSPPAAGVRETHLPTLSATRSPCTRDLRGISDDNDMSKDLRKPHKEHTLSQYSP